MDESKIQRFLQYANPNHCSRDTAIHYLEKHGWDYDKAVDDYWRTHILTCDMN